MYEHIGYFSYFPHIQLLQLFPRKYCPCMHKKIYKMDGKAIIQTKRPDSCCCCCCMPASAASGFGSRLKCMSKALVPSKFSATNLHKLLHLEGNNYLCLQVHQTKLKKGYFTVLII